MTAQIAVIGGTYREICRLPVSSDEIWGSGGRAAAVCAGLGVPTSLHTAVDSQTETAVATLAHTFGFEYATTGVKVVPEFRYVHALAAPNIWPAEVSTKVSIEITAEAALVFGMLEANVKVRGKRVVYDPQNPHSPEPMRWSVDQGQLAYVLNANELRALTGESDLRIAGEKVLSKHGAEVVIVKRGPWGALVFEGGSVREIPAFITKNIWPIGSGDVFAAAFAAYWTASRAEASRAAELASRAAAVYVDTRVLPIPRQSIESTSFLYPPLQLAADSSTGWEFDVYLAGPFFNISQLWLIEEARSSLTAMGLRVFSPYHQIGIGAAHVVAPQDIEALKRSKMVFAIVDGLDPGTLFEVGYARAAGKRVIALASSTPDEAMKMISGTDCEVTSDFISAIYQASWAARQ